jgi:hypothetical protein
MPYERLPPVPIVDSDRFVNSSPMLLRRRTSRLTRTTLKLVAGAPSSSSLSPVWMLRTPMLYAPARPVSRPPTLSGTCRSRCNPMRRL